MQTAHMPNEKVYKCEDLLNSTQFIFSHAKLNTHTQTAHPNHSDFDVKTLLLLDAAIGKKDKNSFRAD